MSLTPALRDATFRWIADDPSEATRTELQGVLARAMGGDSAALADLKDRMAGPLTFGTAGLRGPVRAGTGGGWGAVRAGTGEGWGVPGGDGRFAGRDVKIAAELAQGCHVLPGAAQGRHDRRGVVALPQRPPDECALRPAIGVPSAPAWWALLGKSHIGDVSLTSR